MEPIKGPSQWVYFTETQMGNLENRISFSLELGQRRSQFDLPSLRWDQTRGDCHEMGKSNIESRIAQIRYDLCLSYLSNVIFDSLSP